MSKRLLIAVGILIIAIILISGCIRRPTTPTKEQLNEKISEFKIQYDEKKAQGYDVTEAEDLARKAKEAFDRKDYWTANELLDEAFEALERVKISIIPVEIEVETICIDRIDNDGDGLTDNEDGDCWVREGASFTEEWRYPLKYSDFIKILPELKATGVKTIELLGIHEHCTQKKPGFRWAIRDYYQLDPVRGSEDELNKLIEKAHSLDMKVILLLQSTVTSPPQKVCPGDQSYDKDGIGGHLYHYQINNPDKEILLRDANGNFLCHYSGWGYSINRASPDVIVFLSEWFEKEVKGRGFDGMWIDSPVDNYCFEGEKIGRECKLRSCPNPIPAGDYSSLHLFRALRGLKTPDQIFVGEHQSTKATKSYWACDFPYYPIPDMDEVAECSQDPGLMKLLKVNVIPNKLTSEEFVDWTNNRPILYGRQRINMCRYFTTLDQDTVRFILEDKRYYPVVTLLSTIPGVPHVSYYELFGAKELPTSLEKAEEHRALWKKNLNTRNSNNALKYGSISNVWKSGDNTYAYLRSYEDEKAIVVLNFQDKTVSSVLDLPFEVGITLYDALNDESFVVSDPSNFKITLPAYGSRILVSEKGGV